MTQHLPEVAMVFEWGTGGVSLIPSLVDGEEAVFATAVGYRIPKPEMGHLKNWILEVSKFWSEETGAAYKDVVQEVIKMVLEQVISMPVQ